VIGGEPVVGGPRLLLPKLVVDDDANVAGANVVGAPAVVVLVVGALVVLVGTVLVVVVLVVLVLVVVVLVVVVAIGSGGPDTRGEPMYSKCIPSGIGNVPPQAKPWRRNTSLHKDSRWG
jgi:hypothetical protein